MSSASMSCRDLLNTSQKVVMGNICGCVGEGPLGALEDIDHRGREGRMFWLSECTDIWLMVVRAERCVQHCGEAVLNAKEMVCWVVL